MITAFLVPLALLFFALAAAVRVDMNAGTATDRTYELDRAA